MAYRKYDPMVKKMIIESGIRNLFPDLNIPRTTINYWLKECKERVTVESESTYERRVQKLKEENFELKAKNLLLKKMYHNFLEEVEVHNLKGKEKRKQAIELIESFRDFLTLKEILKTIGVSPSSYYRW